MMNQLCRPQFGESLDRIESPQSFAVRNGSISEPPKSRPSFIVISQMAAAHVERTNPRPSDREIFHLAWMSILSAHWATTDFCRKRALEDAFAAVALLTDATEAKRLVREQLSVLSGKLRDEYGTLIASHRSFRFLMEPLVETQTHRDIKEDQIVTITSNPPEALPALHGTKNLHLATVAACLFIGVTVFKAPQLLRDFSDASNHSASATSANEAGHDVGEGLEETRPPLPTENPTAIIVQKSPAPILTDSTAPSRDNRQSTERAATKDLIRMVSDRPQTIDHAENNDQVTEAACLRDLAHAENTAGPNSHSVVVCLERLAQFHLQRKSYRPAAIHFERLLRIKSSDGTSSPLEIIACTNQLAKAYCGQERYAEAALLLTNALEHHKENLDPDHPDTLACVNQLANTSLQIRDYPLAEAMFERVLLSRKARLGSNPLGIAESADNLAMTYFLQRRFADAKPLFEQSFEIRTKECSPDDPLIAVSLNWLGVFSSAEKNDSKANEYFTSSEAIMKRAAGNDSIWTAMRIDNRAKRHFMQGQYEQAARLFQHVLSIQQTAYDPVSPDVLVTRRLLERATGLSASQVPPSPW